MTDLDKLIEAVEAGHLPTFPVSCRAVGSVHAVDVDEAFSGSLDASLELFDVLLPGWDYCIDYMQRIKIMAYVQFDGGPQFDGEDKCPARALLLAILKAYRAQVQP